MNITQIGSTIRPISVTRAGESSSQGLSRSEAALLAKSCPHESWRSPARANSIYDRSIPQVSAGSNRAVPLLLLRISRLGDADKRRPQHAIADREAGAEHLHDRPGRLVRSRHFEH